MPENNQTNSKKTIDSKIRDLLKDLNIDIPPKFFGDLDLHLTYREDTPRVGPECH